MTRSTAFLRRWAPFVLALALSACAGVAPAPAAKPRLVVLFVVDGLPQRQVTAYRDQLAPYAATHASDATTAALDSLAGAVRTATTLPAAAAHELVTAAQGAFTTSLGVVAGVGAVLFVACAVIALRVLRTR